MSATITPTLARPSTTATSNPKSTVALRTAASSQIDANPTTAEFLNALYEFKGQKYTTLGGLAPALTFNKGGTPQVPYCLFGAQSNAQNTGWARVDSTMKCTDTLAPSDPQVKNKGH